MKLRSKLLISVGLLLLLLVVLMYVLPTYLVKKDVREAAKQVHYLVEDDQAELVKNQRFWLRQILQSTKENINALLFMTYEQRDLVSKLSLAKNPETAWQAAAILASYNDDIGFVQLHDPQDNRAAVLTPALAKLYPVSSLHGPLKVEIEGQEPFVSVPLPEEMQKEKGVKYYALLDSEEVKDQLELLEKELHAAGPKTEREPPAFFDPDWQIDEAFSWAVKTRMIQLLTPLFAEGLEISDGTKRIPAGLARLDHYGNGIAILSSETYSTTPLFDDKAHFELNAPPTGSIPLARDVALFSLPETNMFFMGNTLRLNSTFLTIAAPVSSIAQQLAIAANKMILMRLGEDHWVGFDQMGNSISEEKLKGFLDTGLYNQQKGVINVDGLNYLFVQIASFDQGELAVYHIHSLKSATAIINTLMQLENKLATRISWQLSLVALCTMGLILLYMGRVLLSIVRPISKLAKATEDVAEGRYQDVKIPDVGNRKDEVAILTRHFASMVVGLAEREKIRGVLDKVVSKDVAEEILKTALHLGGEDRVVTMLFGDIRRFTELTENLSPQETIHMLNACMTKISRVIEGEGGVIDKYVGDEVMAIYGAPNIHADHALRAVSSGMLIVETLKKWNEERREKGEALIEMGFGIHTGIVVAGNMGAEDRLNYTVLGANVNLAARLCDAARPNQLIISEDTLNEPDIRDSFYVELLQPISLKGFSEPIKIYQVIGFKWE